MVDDGSTDGTARELERFADEGSHRPTAQRRLSGGVQHRLPSRRAVTSWRCAAPTTSGSRSKLEWQVAGDPGASRGGCVLRAREVGRPHRAPSTPARRVSACSTASRSGTLSSENAACAHRRSLIRRSLFERLGPFVEEFGADDWEYWFRCLRAGARFYYDPRPLLSWRQHESNLTRRTAWMDECSRPGAPLVRGGRDRSRDSRMRSSGPAAGWSTRVDPRGGPARVPSIACDTGWATSPPPPTSRALVWVVHPGACRRACESGWAGRWPAPAVPSTACAAGGINRCHEAPRRSAPSSRSTTPRSTSLSP